MWRAYGVFVVCMFYGCCNVVACTKCGIFRACCIHVVCVLSVCCVHVMCMYVVSRGYIYVL